MTPACSLRLPAAKAAKAEMDKFSRSEECGVWSEITLSAEFSAERVTSSPPELGGVRGGLNKGIVKRMMRRFRPPRPDGLPS